MAEVLARRSIVSVGLFAMALVIGGSWMYSATKPGASQIASADAVPSDSQQMLTVVGTVKSTSTNALTVADTTSTWSFVLNDATSVTKISGAAMKEPNAAGVTKTSASAIAAGDEVSISFTLGNGTTSTASAVTILAAK